ncbi:S8 family serine peptidase [Cytobacillus firmus]|uniref:S8 family serine peptidase n=1 Tax=Cytobacillus firmus TaxID=1399 RepID=UPI0021855995|nr:S8 family serine peptidase [Cytobacillus firmus]URM33416.1 S8 family serine peptidase [Cytobacillus firmus]
MKKIRFIFCKLTVLFMFICFLGKPVTPLAEGSEIPSDTKDQMQIPLEGKDIVPQELIVKFKSSVSSEEKNNILKSVDAIEISSLKKGAFSLVKVSGNLAIQDVLKVMRGYKLIEFAEPNRQVRNAYIPQDPRYGEQWHLEKIKMKETWNHTMGSSDIKVAVIDSGVQLDHPDLAGRLIDPYDVITGSSTFTPDEHGTHVAGIIGANLNNIGVAGIASNITIMPINVFEGDAADLFSIVEAIHYAADNGADIINMSFSSNAYSLVMEQAIEYADSKGVLLIAAAGNEGSETKTYPAAYEPVIAVSATDSKDKLASFSNYGSYIDISAPGSGILSTVPNGVYGYMSGTSMAAPVVSGVAALILSSNPKLNADEVREIILASSEDLGSPGKDIYFGAGRIDALKAIIKTLPPKDLLIVSHPEFYMNGKNKNIISVNAPSGKKVGLYIENSNRQMIKKLAAKDNWSGGEIIAEWDGKQGNGLYAYGGSYKVIAAISDGSTKTFHTEDIKIIDQINPAVKLSSKK